MPGLSDTLGLVGDRPTEEIIRRLTLDITRRLDGMLHGDFMGIVPGRGSEPGEARAYAAGDDVRHIDWNVTARMQVPYLRETIADRELETWMLVDRSSGLDFGTAECEKRDLVLAASAGVGLLTARGGNRVGAVLLRGAEVTTVPPRQGRRSLLGILDRVLESPRQDGTGIARLGLGMRRISAVAPRRGLVVVVSDFLSDPAEWQHALGSLALRHSVLCIEVVDPRDVELPAVGMLQFEDPATGRVREVNTDDRKVRERYAAAAGEQRAAIVTAIRSAGADHLVLRTDGDWLLELARHVARRRHRAEITAGRRVR
ncbi:MAG: DUF58 domain-containing protein [Microthrixaceae bacterium]